MDAEVLCARHPKIRGPYSRTAGLEMLSKLSEKCGIYVIVPHDWAWVYVGSSSSLSRRMSEHWSELQHQLHPKKQMQEDHLDGMEFSYYFQICDSREEAYEQEQALLDFYADHPGLLNVSTDAKLPWRRREDYVSPLQGQVRNEEVKRKISETAKSQFVAGRTVPFKGKTHSLQTKKLMSEKAKLRIVSEETKAKLSSQRQLGKNAKARAVVINGVEYDCVKSASIALGVSYPATYWRVSTDNPNYSEWSFKKS